MSVREKLRSPSPPLPPTLSPAAIATCPLWQRPACLAGDHRTLLCRQLLPLLFAAIQRQQSLRFAAAAGKGSEEGGGRGCLPNFVL